MFPSLPAPINDELAQLAQRYGQPIVQTVNLGANTFFDPLNKSDRYGEVCMVIRRKNGRLLTAIKTFYPRGAYRLLTGGINYGEPVLDALLRETHEETGLEVEVKRFLAAVAYQLNSNEPPNFYTFAFLLDEVGGTFGVLDKDERVESFREIEPSELPAVANFLSHLGHQQSEEINGDLNDWGRFRAVIHRLVWKALSQQNDD
jgi:ADP-ribose pyrophosphatase YjhB (NUDIX family)